MNHFAPHHASDGCGPNGRGNNLGISIQWHQYNGRAAIIYNFLCVTAPDNIDFLRRPTLLWGVSGVFLRLTRLFDSWEIVCTRFSIAEPARVTGREFLVPVRREDTGDPHAGGL